MTGIYALTVEQGATFDRTLTWKDGNDTPIDLTGYTARLQMRARRSSDTAFADLTTENGGIVLGGVLGTIRLSMSATDTTALTDRHGVYDLEMISGMGVVTRLLEGTVTVSREVSRA